MKTKSPHLLIALALFAGILRGLAQPILGIGQASNQVVLYWPVTPEIYVLQSSPDLSPPVWSDLSLAQVIVNGQNTVTNAITGTQQFYQLSLLDTPSFTPDGMALIPAGSFTIGDTLDGDGDAIPTNVYVSGFFMDTNLVSYSQWQSVYEWATNNGYAFDFDGFFKAANLPIQTVDWYDVVKWSNARSQQAGLTPVYYADAGLTQVYTTGEVTNPYVNWTASGYRLPTEAEWEKAARGGLSGQRFPWGDTISESQANYDGFPGGYSYDLGPNGYNTKFDKGGYPFTSPGGSFAPNGYGLYDMAGNVFEWCWDWFAYNPYPTGSPYLGGSDPRGPDSSPFFDSRVLRGGSWSGLAENARCASRDYNLPGNVGNDIGFRCVRGL